MHSKIFQITRTRVYQDNYLNEGTLTQGDDSFFDYCAEIDDKERKHHIGVLVNHILPEGMFELVSEDVIRYIGGADKWQADFVAGMRSKAEKPARYGLLVLHGRGGLPILCRTVLRVHAGSV